MPIHIINSNSSSYLSCSPVIHQVAPEQRRGEEVVPSGGGEQEEEAELTSFQCVLSQCKVKGGHAHPTGAVIARCHGDAQRGLG